MASAAAGRLAGVPAAVAVAVAVAVAEVAVVAALVSALGTRGTGKRSPRRMVRTCMQYAIGVSTDGGSAASVGTVLRIRSCCSTCS